MSPSKGLVVYRKSNHSQVDQSIYVSGPLFSAWRPPHLSGFSICVLVGVEAVPVATVLVVVRRASAPPLGANPRTAPSRPKCRLHQTPDRISGSSEKQLVVHVCLPFQVKSLSSSSGRPVWTRHTRQTHPLEDLPTHPIDDRTPPSSDLSVQPWSVSF